MTTKKATIKDVAREAKVSVASVSRALNGQGGVTAETLDRIRVAAKRLHYIPDNAARSLITRRTHTIGALLPDLFGEFFSELIRGIDLAARSRGLHLLVSSSHDGADEAATALRAMQGRVDGMLILSPWVDEAFLEANMPGELPTVLINSPVQGRSVLNIDNRGGAYAMTEHLLRTAGHKDIAFIAGPAGNFDAEQRELGFREAMKKFAPQVPLNIVAGSFTEESGYHAGRELLKQAHRPAAVFAANDMMAVGCLYAFKEAGLQVPGDMALAGFDDIPIARYLSPPLSTVSVHIAELGRNALERLSAQMDGRQPSDRTDVLGCAIAVRETCGGSRDASSKNTYQPARTSDP
ncbi:MAG TPA: LacI family DNA-binding transcriptional regulator [Dyella sp.]|uniref:LacI family DNA-binding transcriptional regulator n=1 Tax=Dyella sp. TaxID=1869338 RepID=UPI002D79142A|nr:LacI family DNA-binding transcriptional regulator [Dyella sp.]HET6555190.1 LacI family DNA-binding transcriptional regulator [Dyella sp.]